jgi:hypothetical protein
MSEEHETILKTNYELIDQCSSAVACLKWWVRDLRASDYDQGKQKGRGDLYMTINAYSSIEFDLTDENKRRIEEAIETMRAIEDAAARVTGECDYSRQIDDVCYFMNVILDKYAVKRKRY